MSFSSFSHPKVFAVIDQRRRGVAKNACDDVIFDDMANVQIAGND